ncbi:MAG: gamma carbonic anhydrase family protein [Candidatus Natronoplasma sp.]
MTEELEEFLPGKEEDSAFLDPTARIVGEVEIGENAFLFPGSLIEGEESDVTIGDGSIMMNKSSVRSTKENPASIGKDAFIAHGARLRGCEIGEGSLVGMDAVVMEGAEVGKGAIVGTDAIVPEGMEVPDGKLVLGQPAEVIEDVSEEDLQKIDEIRERLQEKRDEFKMIEKRGQQFGVFEAPKRPDEILEERKAEMKRVEEDVPDIEKVKEKLKELEEDHYSF